MNKELLGKRIQEKRLEAGYSLKDLSERLGITRQYVSRWEHGIAVPDVACLDTISKIFHTDIRYFLGDNDAVDEKQEYSLADTRLTEREFRLINHFRLMSPARQEAMEILFDRDR